MRGLRIGRLFGITISVDWSWLLIFALISWSLATAFGAMHPAWDVLTRWGVALVGAVFFFASVLAHELAHSLVAKSRHIPVDSITLFLFGGVSSIEQEPKSPFEEFIIAIVGPLTSFILGGAFLALALGSLVSPGVILNPTAALASRLSPLDTVAIWLGSINILLGLFNLIPGFPLDGGRVLRSILWAIRDDVVWATRWASFAGRAFAFLLMASGAVMLIGWQVPFLGGGLVNGVWLILIGLFLQSAASQSYSRVLIHARLEDVPVQMIMRTELPIVPAYLSVDDLVEQYILHTEKRTFIVTDGSWTVGLVTVEDVANVPPDLRREKTVRAIMTPSAKLASVTPEDKAAEAFDRLESRGVRLLPVVRGNTIVGVLRLSDIRQWLALHSPTPRGLGA
jgi:Zn-dependent protease/predicted transcriptional regulator